jgi:hypothetical protein
VEASLAIAPNCQLSTGRRGRGSAAPARPPHWPKRAPVVSVSDSLRRRGIGLGRQSAENSGMPTHTYDDFREFVVLFSQVDLLIAVAHRALELPAKAGAGAYADTPPWALAAIAKASICDGNMLSWEPTLGTRPRHTRSSRRQRAGPARTLGHRAVFGQRVGQRRNGFLERVEDHPMEPREPKAADPYCVPGRCPSGR